MPEETLNNQEDNNSKGPSVEKGVGGAGRVAGMLADEKPTDNRGSLMRLLGYLNEFKWIFILALILNIIAAITQVTAPQLVGQIINIITENLSQDIPVPWERTIRIGLLLLVTYVVNFFASYFSSTSMVRLTQKVIRTMRIQMQEKLNRLTLDYFDRSSTGDLVSLLTNDLDNIANTLQTGLTNALTAVVIVIGVVIMMFTIDPVLAILAQVVVPIAYVLVNFLVKRAKPIFQSHARLTGEFNGKVEEAYQGEDIVKYYGLEEELKEEAATLNEALFESEWKSSYASFMTRPAGDLILNVDYVLVTILGGYYVIQGKLSLGELQAFLRYTQMIASPFQQVLGIMNTILSALASAERIFKFLDAPEIEQIGTATMDTEGIQGNIDFNGVDFGYTDQLLFKDVDLHVEPGQQLAIVGSTGAGKTTLVNLLMRFYEIDGGEITLDGTNLQDYHTDEARKAFSMVLQDTWLFAGSIRDNIAYGAPLDEGQDLKDVPMEKVIEAAKLARAHSFISRLPNGYDTILTEGASNLSQGQRQLLTIARALIKRAPIIILDEATSSVDTRTELLIQEGMKELTSQSTSFIIAHRLSTIHDSDQIIVMDHGSIVETGNHEELLAKNGHYASMYLADKAQ